MSDLVGNPDDRFSCDKPYLLSNAHNLRIIFCVSQKYRQNVCHKFFFINSNISMVLIGEVTRDGGPSSESVTV